VINEFRKEIEVIAINQIGYARLRFAASYSLNRIKSKINR